MRVHSTHVPRRCPALPLRHVLVRSVHRLEAEVDPELTRRGGVEAFDDIDCSVRIEVGRVEHFIEWVGEWVSG